MVAAAIARQLDVRPPDVERDDRVRPYGAVAAPRRDASRSVAASSGTAVRDARPCAETVADRVSVSDRAVPHEPDAARRGDAATRQASSVAAGDSDVGARSTTRPLAS